MKTMFSKKMPFKKAVIGSFALGITFSGVSAFASSSAVIPASVVVQEEDILAVTLTLLGTGASLLFEPTRGEWDSKSFKISNTGNVNFNPSITYETAIPDKFEGASVAIEDSTKLLLKNGDNLITGSVDGEKSGKNNININPISIHFSSKLAM